MNNFACVILAGGKSTRMGEDKSFVKIKEQKTMLSVQIDKLKEISNNIWLSANDDVYKNMGFPVLSDVYKDIGPMGGIYTALKAIPDFYVFFISVDLPFVTKLLINSLIQNVSDEVDIVLPIYEGKYEPVCAVYSKNCLSKIENMIANNNYKLNDLISNCKIKTIDASDEIKNFPYLFKNINSPQDIIL